MNSMTISNLLKIVAYVTKILLSVNFEYLNIIHNNLTYVVFKKFATPVKGSNVSEYANIAIYTQLNDKERVTAALIKTVLNKCIGNHYVIKCIFVLKDETCIPPTTFGLYLKVLTGAARPACYTDSIFKIFSKSYTRGSKFTDICSKLKKLKDKCIHNIILPLMSHQEDFHVIELLSFFLGMLESEAYYYSFLLYGVET
ncbi:hypothetical protein AGLY_000583 [Aphis glycines]|uniref:Uncharacterized protein n=1 Tax=Aphis glycines TaxID=307491 RepID=A0A6G0U8F1_APHGL|nr:hypothetical protein AGLY_000583 [Aphis glycines]